MIEHKRIIVTGSVALISIIIVTIIFLQPNNDKILPVDKSPTATQHEPSQYKACGCGCCPFIEAQEVCLSRVEGDTMTEIIEQDKSLEGSPNCAFVGCALPTIYRYCD